MRHRFQLRRAGSLLLCGASLALCCYCAVRGLPVSLPDPLLAMLIPEETAPAAQTDPELFAAEGIVLDEMEQENPELTGGEDWGTFLLPSPTPAPFAEPRPAAAIDVAALTVKGTASQTHQGTVYIKNSTSAKIDAKTVLATDPGIKFAASGPRVLIIHSHGSESYNVHGGAWYLTGDTSRDLDVSRNVVRVGDELASILNDAGIPCIHSTTMYDQPTYSTSYSSALKGLKSYLAKYPSVRVVIDLHRDALGGGGAVKYKVVSRIGEETCAQLMFVMGTNVCGLSHPNWRKNLAFAARVQQAVLAKYPTLMRPITMSKNRYNQHVTPGSCILEVGTDGNTQEEALAAIRHFGPVLAEVLKSMGA